MSISNERLAELIRDTPQWIQRGWVDDDVLPALRELQQRRVTLSGVDAGTHVIVSKAIWSVASKYIERQSGPLMLAACEQPNG